MNFYKLWLMNWSVREANETQRQFGPYGTATHLNTTDVDHGKWIGFCCKLMPTS
jgi:hypothetical protein